MSRDVLTVGSTIRIPLLYRGEYSQWSERFMNYLEEQTNGEAMINSIKNGDQPLPRVTQWKQYATMMRQNKNLMEINIDALYNILKKNQGYVNDAIGLKKKNVVVTSDPLALIAEKIKVSKRKDKVVVSSNSEASDEDDFSEMKKITALAKAFNRRKFYAKPTNNNLRTSSASNSANKKQEFMKSDDKIEDNKVEEKKRDMSKVKCYNYKKECHFAKDCKKVKIKDYEYYKTKMLHAKKDKDEQVLLAEDHAWMESSSDSDQEINANMVFMAQVEKVLSDSEASSSSSDDKIAEVSYYTSESESESKYETSEYYDTSTTYGLFVDNNDDQEIFQDSSENFSENLIESQIDHNESDVTHNDFKDLWNTIKKIGKTDGYNFKLDRKKCRVNTKVFHEILQICPRLPNQDFLELPSEEDLLTFLKEHSYSSKCDMLSTVRTDQMHQHWMTFAAEDFMYQAEHKQISSARKEHMPYLRFTKVIIHHFISKDNTFSMRNRINLYTARDDTLLGTLKFVSKTKDYQKYGALIPDGMINQDIKDSKAYKTYLDYATRKVPPKKARKFKNPASPKLKIVPASPKEPTRKGKRVKRAAKKATTTPTTGVVIRDTPGKSVSKKKAPTKTDRGKGIELLSDAALLKDAQLKETLRKASKKPTSFRLAAKLRELIFIQSEEKSDDVHDEDDNDNEDGNDDDGGNDAQDSEQTDSDDDEDPFFTLKDYEEEEQYEEYVLTPERDKAYDEDKMYEEKDDDVAKELYGDLKITLGLRDIDMTNAEQCGEDQQNASYESGFVQEEEDAHVTLTTVHDKTEGPLQSSSISSNFTSKLLNLDDPSLDINSLMNTSTVTSPPPSVNPSSHPTTIPQQQTPDSTTTTTYPTMTLPEIPNFASTQADEPEFKVADTEMQQDQGNESGSVFNLLKGTCKSFAKLEYHLKECYKAFNDRLDWKNPEGRKYLLNLSKPLPLIEDRGCQVVPADYFINNDLEYLKAGSSSSKYTTSTRRTKAAKYDNIEGI
nr:RNA-directed DNA polymerase, eukaryota [Tanacetum cinerariifolium]